MTATRLVTRPTPATTMETSARAAIGRVDGMPCAAELEAGRYHAQGAVIGAGQGERQEPRRCPPVTWVAPVDRSGVQHLPTDNLCLSCGGHTPPSRKAPCARPQFGEAAQPALLRKPSRSLSRSTAPNSAVSRRCLSRRAAPGEPQGVLGSLAIVARGDPDFLDRETGLMQPAGESFVGCRRPYRQYPIGPQGAPGGA